MPKQCSTRVCMRTARLRHYHPHFLDVSICVLHSIAGEGEGRPSTTPCLLPSILTSLQIRILCLFFFNFLYAEEKRGGVFVMRLFRFTVLRTRANSSWDRSQQNGVSNVRCFFFFLLCVCVCVSHLFVIGWKCSVHLGYNEA